MKRKVLKYNIVMILLVLLVGAYFALSFLLNPNMQDSGANNSEIVIDSGGSVDDDYVPETNGQTFELPADPYEAVNNAINLYNNGKGSVSYFKYVIENTGEIPKGLFLNPTPISTSVTQYVAGKTMRNANENMEEAYFYYSCKDALVEKALVDNHLIRHGYRAINIDNLSSQAHVVESNSISINKADSNISGWSSDLSGCEVQDMSISDALDNYKIIYSMEFPLKIDSSVCDVKQIDKRSDKNFITYSFSYNVALIGDNFRDYFKANGGLNRVTFQTYTYDFKISKKSGRLDQMTCKQTFVSTGLGGKLTINSTATLIQKFQKLDSEVKVDAPYLNVK